MKNLIYLLPVALFMAACGGGKKKEAKASLKTDKEKASYAVGLTDGMRLMAEIQQSGFDTTALDMKLVLEGIKDQLEKKPRLLQSEIQSVMERYFRQLGEKQVEEFKKKNAPKKEAADKFMAENGKQPGIITTESRLQYKVIQEGKGPLVAIGDSVAITYTGKFSDGSIFESNEGKEPYGFTLLAYGRVIQGWVEALQLMKKGGKMQVFIPYDLAYGEMGMAPRGEGDPGMPPYAVLIFDLELVTHVPAKK